MSGYQKVKKRLEQAKLEGKDYHIIKLGNSSNKKDQMTVDTYMNILEDIFNIDKENNLFPLVVTDNELCILPAYAINDKRLLKCLKGVPAFLTGIEDENGDIWVKADK